MKVLAWNILADEFVEENKKIPEIVNNVKKIKRERINRSLRHQQLLYAFYCTP